MRMFANGHKDIGLLVFLASCIVHLASPLLYAAPPKEEPSKSVPAAARGGDSPHAGLPAGQAGTVPSAPPSPAIDLRDIEALAREDQDFAIQLFRQAAQRSLNRSQPAKAVTFYRQALALDPKNLNLVEELADAQVAAKQAKDALASWDEILKVQGGDLGIKFRYANFLVKMGEHDDAITKVRGLAADRPEEPSLRYWIADAYQRAGKSSEAAAELRAMLKAFPGEKPEIERRLGLVEPGVSASGTSAPVTSTPSASAPGTSASVKAKAQKAAAPKKR